MMPLLIRQLFDSYRDAFTRLDGDAVAACFHAPSMMARRDGYALWGTAADVQENCAALVGFYRDRGTERAEYTVRAILLQGPHFATVTLHWTFFWRHEPNPLLFHATYNLFEQWGEWRILLCTVFD